MIDIRKNKIYIKAFDKVKKRMIKAGLSDADASAIADCFAVSDSFGVYSHGSRLTDSYVEMIREGKFNLNPSFKTIFETVSFAKVDGDNAIGILSAKHCLDLAIDKAKKIGLYTIFSNNNNTIGAAFYYSLLAAEKGLICFICSNSPAQMAIPFGGTKKMLGTNPFSICFPTEEYPIIIDMATSVVAKSKLIEFKDNNLPLPQGWAFDINGNPTTDPNEALNGFIAPMAGIKGYSLSLAIDLVAGLISGASYLDNVGKFYNNNHPMNVGISLVLINPKIVYGQNYDLAIKEYINKIRMSPSNNSGLVLPGDDRIAFHKKHLV